MKNKNLISAVVIVLVFVVGIVLYAVKKPGTTPDGMTLDENGNYNVDLVAGRVAGYVKSPTLGAYLTDSEGMTLYTFADDKKLQSTCYGECAKLWLPFKWDTTQKWETLEDAQAKKMNALKRTDGTYQTAYGEKPLYFYIADKKPGDVNGNGIDGKWSIVPITN